MNAVTNGNVSTVRETVLYYHSDHLGSTQYLTDQCGYEVEHTEYLPYGQTFTDDTNAASASDPSTNPTTFNPAASFKYTDKNLDAESGLYYYGARYFDPKAQVWLSPDPILGQYMAGKPNGGVYTAQNLGLYTYGSENPVRYVDPDGNWPIVLEMFRKGGPDVDAV